MDCARRVIRSNVRLCLCLFCAPPFFLASSSRSRSSLYGNWCALSLTLPVHTDFFGERLASSYLATRKSPPGSGVASSCRVSAVGLQLMSSSPSAVVSVDVAACAGSSLGKGLTGAGYVCFFLDGILTLTANFWRTPDGHRGRCFIRCFICLSDWCEHWTVPHPLIFDVLFLFGWGFF